MLKFLKKPYPFNDDLQYNAKLIFFISIGVLAFLYIFQPIEISSFSPEKVFYLVVGLGVSTFAVLSLNLMVLPSLFPKLLNNSKWTILKEILWNLWILLVISSADLLYYSKLMGFFNITLSHIFTIILVSVLPVGILIFVNQERLFRQNLKSAKEISKKIHETKHPEDKLVHIKSDYKNDSLSLNPDTIIMIKSANNYIEVLYNEDDQIKKQMIRTSLSKTEEILFQYEFLFKSHRSYIINANLIHEINGNSQGYIVHFENTDVTAQVSQKYINDFQKLI